MANLPLYLSAPNACSYRPDQTARSAFIDPRLSLNTEQREALANLGFRRSGPNFYRPACADCNACESARVHVPDFQTSRAQKRCWKTNQDLIASWSAATSSDEKFRLYQRYLRSRHGDGDMDADDREGFERFLCSSQDSLTRHLLIRDTAGRLLAVCVADRLLSGWSAVYTFFEPDEVKRSLGRYAVLRLIETSRAAELPWVYLGYYIADCTKMNYKNEYKPQQRFRNQQWEWADN